jgi:hypothetical protein
MAEFSRERGSFQSIYIIFTNFLVSWLQWCGGGCSCHRKNNNLTFGMEKVVFHEHFHWFSPPLQTSRPVKSSFSFFGDQEALYQCRIRWTWHGQQDHEVAIASQPTQSLLRPWYWHYSKWSFAIRTLP